MRAKREIFTPEIRKRWRKKVWCTYLFTELHNHYYSNNASQEKRLVYGSAVVYNRVAATRGSRSNSKQHYCITQIAHLVFGFSSVNNSELTRPLRDNPSVVYWYSGVHLDCDKNIVSHCIRYHDESVVILGLQALKWNRDYYSLLVHTALENKYPIKWGYFDRIYLEHHTLL